jgi:hypothetical protein
MTRAHFCAVCALLRLKTKTFLYCSLKGGFYETTKKVRKVRNATLVMEGGRVGSAGRG